MLENKNSQDKVTIVGVKTLLAEIGKLQEALSSLEVKYQQLDSKVIDILNN